jgi:large subunit ribosomal protein L6
VSRIGKRAIDLPDNVEASIEIDRVILTGAKGRLEVLTSDDIKVSVDGRKLLLVNLLPAQKSSRAKHGLYRALIFNAMKGVSDGFVINLEIVGVGYRVALQGTGLLFSLGYSHQISFDAPEGVVFQIEGQNKIKIIGIDKQLLGQTAAKIRELRSPDAYKGKGIRFAGEVIKTKQGKSVKK